MKMVNKNKKIVLATVLFSAFGLLAGCASKPKVHYTPAKKQTIKQLRHGYIQSLRDNGVRVIKVGQTIHLIFPSDQMFHYNSANILASYRPVLSTAASLMHTYDKVSVQVAAFSDTKPRAFGPSNRKKVLTTRQAQVVSNFLWSRGINARLIYAVGKGSKHPVARNNSYLSSVNNRVEVTFRFYPRTKKYE